MVEKVAWHDWPATPDPVCYILNQQLRQWGHQFGYSPKMLRASLEAAGFLEIQELAPGATSDPVFRGIEMRAFSSVREINQFEAQVFEAVRGPAPAASAMHKPKMTTAPPQ